MGWRDVCIGDLCAGDDVSGIACEWAAMSVDWVYVAIDQYVHL